MIDKLIDFCIDKWPGITILVIIAAIIFWLAWQLSKYYTIIEDTKKKVNGLPCEKHHIQLAGINELKDIVSSTNGVVVEMSRWIARKDKSMIDTFIRKNSPYTITGIGRQLLEESGAKKTIDNHIDFFIKELEAINPKTPYDVEDQSMSLVFRNMSNEIFGPVKNFIYYAPDKLECTDPDTGQTREIEISYPALLNVMGIYLRDQYMKKHPEIENMPELKPQK
jgi:hypothetical protein